MTRMKTIGKRFGALILSLCLLQSASIWHQAKAEGAVPDKSRWTATAYRSGNNLPASNAVDSNSNTRWQNGEAQKPDGSQWFQIDFGSAAWFDTVTIHSGADSDYLRGYRLDVSADGQAWTAAAQGAGESGNTVIHTDVQTAQYIRIVQTGEAAGNWWSINEIDVSLNRAVLPIPDKSAWSASVYRSGNNLPASNLIDGNDGTRWQNGEAQMPDANQWVKIDLGALATFTTVTVYSGTDGDYFRGYALEVSADGEAWSAVAAGDGQAQNTVIAFPAQTARYVRIFQTGTANSNWWSINEITILYEKRETAASKKGVCASRYSAQLRYLEELGVSWYYNWGYQPTTSQTTAMEFVPMLWNGAYVNPTVLQSVRGGVERGDYKNLLAFNEPDLPGDSYVSVEDAIALWPQLEDLGVRLGSPACANYSSGWLNEFMTQAQQRGYRVDFIAIHIYQDYSNPDQAVRELESIVNEIHELYNLPVWVTEFGTVDISTWAGETRPGCYEVENAKEYERKSLALLERLGYVERYSWFVDNFNPPGGNRPAEAPFTALYNDDDTLSVTGGIYKALESTTGMDVQITAQQPAAVGQAYRAVVTATGGTGPYTYAAASLPAGLTLDAATGEITGVPSSLEAFTARIAVTDANGQSLTVPFMLADLDSLVLTPLDRTGWDAQYMWYTWYGSWGAWSSAAAGQILDGNGGTFYRSEKQTANDSFLIDFGAQTTLDAIAFTVGSSGEYPTAFKVLYDVEGVWKTLHAKSRTTADTTTCIAQIPVTTSKIMIQLTADAGDKPWSVSELEVYKYTPI